MDEFLYRYCKFCLKVKNLEKHLIFRISSCVYNLAVLGGTKLGKHTESGDVKIALGYQITGSCLVCRFCKCYLPCKD